MSKTGKRHAFTRRVSDDFQAMAMMEAILDNGGVVVSVTAAGPERGSTVNGRPRELPDFYVFAVFETETWGDTAVRVDEAFRRIPGVYQ